MKFNPAEWQFRLQYMTLKQLLHLCELSRLPDSIGCGEEMVPPLQHPDAESDLYFAINDQWSKERNTLSKMILEQTEKTCRGIHEEEFRLCLVYAVDEGFTEFLVWWHH